MPKEQAYDGATAILVSQFIMESEKRIEFFKGIFNRLRPGGALISADLALPKVSEKVLTDLWAQMQIYTGVSKEDAKSSTSQWGKMVSVLAPWEVQELVEQAGFKEVTQFYQALFIHAWCCRK